MEAKLLNLYLESRKNHTQIVSFVSGGMAIFVGAILNSTENADSKGYLMIGVAIISLILVFIHFNAYFEHKEITSALHEKNEFLASFTKRFQKIIVFSGLGFVTTTVICIIMACKYLTG